MPRTIEEICDVWLNSRGQDGSNWGSAIGAIYELGVKDERERCAALAEAVGCVGCLMYLEFPPNDGRGGEFHWDANHKRHDHRCPVAIVAKIRGGVA